ncbi:MAG TPA: hypothetical protein PLP35_09465, partial [Caldisericia bacterium]|nr:hypothetical protein [Caldisericia bacterium]
MRRITAVMLAAVLLLSMFIAYNDLDINAQAIAAVEFNSYPWETVEGSIYNPFSSVSKNDGISQLSSIAIDSAGFPHMVYQDNSTGNNEIFYTFWNGSYWAVAGGDAYNPWENNANISRNNGDSAYPVLVLDNADNPHISWHDNTPGNYEIFYIKYDNPSLNWINSQSINYDPATNNANISTNSGRSWFPSMTLDSTNNPHIVWDDFTYGNREILYSWWNGSDWICTDGSTYNPATGNARVSQNGGHSCNPTIELDASDTPHIAWHDFSYGNREVMYVKWDGNNWSCDDGIVYNPATGNANVSSNGGTSDNASLEIDSLGNPHLSWWDGSYGSLEIVYMYWDGNDWLCADGSVYNPTNYVNSNPVNVSRNSGYSEHPFLELDSSNTPHIVWCDDSYGNTEILYVRWDGSNWVCSNSEIYNPTIGNSNISNSNQDSRIPVMAIDSSQIVWVSWFDTSFGNSEIMLNKLMGTTWTVPSEAVYDLSTGNANVSRNASSSIQSFDKCLALDSLDYPHIVWSDNFTGNNDIFYVRWSGNDWVCANGDLYDPLTGNANVSINSGNSRNVSMCLDNLGNPHIAWRDDTPGNDEIFYVKWDGMNWVCADESLYNPATNNANISQNTGWSGEMCLVVDKLNNPHISWYDFSYGGQSEIIYMHWDGVNWVTATDNIYDPVSGNANISNTSSYSYVPSLCLDNNDNPCISWQDYSFGGLYEILFLRWDDVSNKWVCANGNDYTGSNAVISANSGNSEYPSLAIDSLNNPHISWTDHSYNGNWEVLYVEWDGSNWITINGSNYSGLNANISNNNGNSEYPYLVLDSLDYPHLAWQDDSYQNYETMYALWDGGAWRTSSGFIYDSQIGNANISRNAGDSLDPSLVLDSLEKPHLTWDDTTYGNQEILCVRASDSLILPYLSKVIDTDEDDIFTDEFEPVAKCDILTYKVTVSFASEEQSGIFLDTIPECTEFVELVKPTGNIFCNYSDTGWKYYYQYKGTPSGDAKNPMCEIGWWVDAKNGLKQEFVYKVKVRDPARRYLKGKPVGTRLDFRPYVSIKAPKARFFQGKPKGGTSNSNWLYNPIETTASNFNLSSTSASQGVNPIGVTDLGGVVSVIDPI